MRQAPPSSPPRAPRCGADAQPGGGGCARGVGARALRSPRQSFSTHQLGHDDPRWAGIAAHASGVLAFMMPTPAAAWRAVVPPGAGTDGALGRRSAQGWSRPSQGRGAPRLHPRRSFELWKEVVRNRSLRWEAGALHAATQLRRFAIELDLERQVTRERAAVQARDELVAVVSHDLRNPLSVVVMQAAMMQRLLAGEMTESSQRLLVISQTIQRAGQRMVNLLGDLLVLAKIEAGRYQVAARPVPAAEILQDDCRPAAAAGAAQEGASRVRARGRPHRSGRCRARVPGVLEPDRQCHQAFAGARPRCAWALRRLATCASSGSPTRARASTRRAAVPVRPLLAGKAQRLSRGRPGAVHRQGHRRGPWRHRRASPASPAEGATFRFTLPLA